MGRIKPLDGWPRGVMWADVRPCPESGRESSSDWSESTEEPNVLTSTAHVRAGRATRTRQAHKRAICIQATGHHMDMKGPGGGGTTNGPDATPPPPPRLSAKTCGGGGGVLAAQPGGGGVCATHFCNMHTSRGCLGAWGYRGMYAIIAISRLCWEERLKGLKDQRHSTPFS